MEKLNLKNVAKLLAKLLNQIVQLLYSVFQIKAIILFGMDFNIFSSKFNKNLSQNPENVNKKLKSVKCSQNFEPQ